MQSSVDIGYTAVCAMLVQVRVRLRLSWCPSWHRSTQTVLRSTTLLRWSLLWVSLTTHSTVTCCTAAFIWAVMIVWRIRGKVIRTVLCCVVYDSCAQWYTHTWAVLKDECWFRRRLSFCAFV